MPELKNMRWELFARAYIKTYANGTQAAIEAGYSPHSAGKQAARLRGYAPIRARIAELAAEANAPGIESMEQARTALYSTLIDISKDSSSDMARVQAGRVLGDLLLMGESGQRVALQLAKLELERERVALQREAIKAGAADKTVAVTVDSGLLNAIASNDNPKKPEI